jgi:hypothetical protein
MTEEFGRSAQAWVAFLLSSALIVATLLPIIKYGVLFLYIPVFLIFGCDGARSAAGCLATLVSPFVPIGMTGLAVVVCRIAIRAEYYVASVCVAVFGCSASWATVTGVLG